MKTSSPRSPRRWGLLGILALATAAAPSTASAQWAVYDAANHLQNIVALARAAAQIANQVRQIEYQLQALQKLGTPTWRELPGFMSQLDYLMSQGEAIGYSAADLNARLERAFPGYRLPADLQLARDTRRQLEGTLATMHGALRSTSRQMQQVNSDLGELRRIKNQMGGIRGHQEALELGATLQAYAAEEAVMLRQEVAVLNNMLAVAHSQQLQQRLQEQAARERMLVNARSRARANSPGFDPTWE